MKDEREIAVKVLTSNSYQGKREFSNEVSFRMIGTSFYIDISGFPLSFTMLNPVYIFLFVELWMILLFSFLAFFVWVEILKNISSNFPLI